MTMDTTLRPLARKLVDGFGKAVTLRRIASGTYDPTTGAISGSVTTDFEIRGVVRSLEDGHVKNTLVETGDLEVTIAAEGLPVEPSANTDSIVMDNGTWAVVSVEPIFSGELAALYNLVVRK